MAKGFKDLPPTPWTMPFTPLHYALAYAIGCLARRSNVKLDMAGLAVGSFVPDLECVAIFLAVQHGLLSPEASWVQTKRLVLHSIIGAITLDALISLALVLVLYWLLRARLSGVRRPSLMNIYTSSAIGALSHVLLDALHHPYNPLLFPITAENLSLAPMGDLQLGFILAHLLVVPSSIAIFIYEYRKGPGLLLRLLFGPEAAPGRSK